MATTEARFSVSYAPGKPALITIRGDSAEEAKAAHDDAVKSGLLEVIKQVQDSLNGAARAAAAGPPAKGIDYERLDKAQQQRQEAAQQPAQELPAGFAEPKCVECQGPTKLVQEGTSKKSGQPFKRYACTVNSLHKSTFTN